MLLRPGTKFPPGELVSVVKLHFGHAIKVLLSFRRNINNENDDKT